MAEGAIATLAKAIGYPDEIPSGSVRYRFSVDDAKIDAVEENGRLLLCRELADAGDIDLAQFAQYAAGRILREDAVLAYDPQSDKVILWQELPARSDAELMKRFFEVFAVSCDWWQARISGAGTASLIPEMMIRP